MAKKQLNQVIAIEKGVKARVTNGVTESRRKISKLELLNGFTKHYEPISEEGETLPKESKVVQASAEKELKKAAALKTELFDVEATKNETNTIAKADVVIDGTAILLNVPTTTLLFLENELKMFKVLVEETATLDSAEDWSLDETTGLFKTDPVSTHRTRKVQRPIVLYDATEHHPAQTQMITEDIVDGYWKTVKMSGALTATRKEELLTKIDKLTDAVKSAREEANMVEATDTKIGAALFGFLGLA